MTDRGKIISVLGVVVLALSFMVPYVVSISTRTPVDVVVNNQSGLYLRFVGVSEGDDDPTIAPNLLTTSLLSGNILRIKHIGHGCKRNIGVRYSDGRVESFKDFYVCGRTSIFLDKRTKDEDGPQNPSFNVINTSKNKMTEIYVKLSDQEVWGPNRLTGTNVVVQGQPSPVYLPSGKCIYDTKIVFEDGQQMERLKNDTCHMSLMPIP